ncbi:MAG: HDOD domain-containing protein [Nitrosomonas sp.]|nr:HDOD domain-containing protein [Nitrosomonas sp.]
MNAHILATNVSSIFSLPDVVFRINELIDSGEASNEELEQTVLHDPAITAKILKFANSAYFGFSGQVETISRAISLIGHKELQNLVIASSVTSTFKGISSDLVDMESFWHHSVNCGVVARLLAVNIESRERFFIAGLLHGVGKLIFYSQYPDESAEILLYKDEGELAVIKAERETFGFTYTELGAELLKQWRLPACIWEMVEAQNAPAMGEESKNDALILSISTNIANHMQAGTAKNRCLDEIAENYKQDDLGRLGLSADVIESAIVVADLQVMEILSVIRPES